jgi:hypothetical protein
MREKDPRSYFTTGRDLHAKEQNVEIGQQFRQQRNPPEPRYPTHAAYDDRQKAVVQQAAKQLRKARLCVSAALKLSLACKVAIQKPL